jgi:hypothetical protein
MNWLIKCYVNFLRNKKDLDYKITVKNVESEAGC